MTSAIARGTAADGQKEQNAKEPKASLKMRDLPKEERERRLVKGWRRRLEHLDIRVHHGSSMVHLIFNIMMIPPVAAGSSYLTTIHPFTAGFAVWCSSGWRMRFFKLHVNQVLHGIGQRMRTCVTLSDARTQTTDSGQPDEHQTIQAGDASSFDHSVSSSRGKTLVRRRSGKSFRCTNLHQTWPVDGLYRS